MSEPAEPEPRTRRAPWVVIGAIGLVVVVAALVIAAVVSSDDGGSGATQGSAAIPLTVDERGTTSPTTLTDGLGEGFGPVQRGRTPLRGFGEASVALTSAEGEVCEVCLLAATTADQRARGLMEVTDRRLGGYDGMVFEYPSPVDGAFYMRNTPMPLSIGFFDDTGAAISATDMAPCDDVEGCPTYPADRPFRYAIEVLQGDLAELGIGPGSTMRILAHTCPSAVTP